jgi:hypothetical protein
LPNTAATVASRKNGDLLRGRSAPSKCDRLNIEWGARDMWFRYDDNEYSDCRVVGFAGVSFAG